MTWPARFYRGLVKRLFEGFRGTGDAPHIPARYRALKRLAIQGNDLEREQAFHAGDIRASRFNTDWPLSWRMLAFSPAAWASVWRFWFGLAYGLLSDFGRSVLRPALAWTLLLAWSAMLYLGANPEVTRARAALVTDKGWPTLIEAYAETTAAAWARNHPCVADDTTVRGLPEPVRAATSAVNQALRLALANGMVLGDIGSPDTGTRTYGCLYGLAAPADGRGPAIVPYPDIVATVAIIQRALSALLLFLFGLAVRNMLKLK